MEKTEKILLEAWSIPKPRLVMTVIGGEEFFKLSDRLETSFINGIIDIAQKSGINLDNFVFIYLFNNLFLQMLGYLQMDIMLVLFNLLDKQLIKFD